MFDFTFRDRRLLLFTTSGILISSPRPSCGLLSSADQPPSVSLWERRAEQRWTLWDAFQILSSETKDAIRWTAADNRGNHAQTFPGVSCPNSPHKWRFPSVLEPVYIPFTLQESRA